MNVSHKCRRYGLLDSSYTGRTAEQATNVSACKMKTILNEDGAIEEKTAQLREDLIVGIYRLQTMKDCDSLYCIGETNASSGEFDISKNCDDIQSVVLDNMTNSDYSEY